MFLDSSSSVIDAILTRKGRELLARNDGSFKITKFSFGDDEVNYGLFDITQPSNPDISILSLPISEPISNEAVALRYRLITLPAGSTRIGTLSIKPRIATIGFGEPFVFTVSTTNSTDNTYIATSRDTDIAVLENNKVNVGNNNEARFITFTGINASGKSGTVVIDVVGVESGSRNTVTLNVSSSGT